jgi:DNA polymerase-3 subunit alpha
MYADIINRYSTASTLTLANVNGKVIITGIIQNLNITRTKRGEAMARGLLEDLHGTVPVVFFPKCFAEYHEAITGEIPVVIKARADLNEDDGDDGTSVKVDLMAEEVYLIDNADSIFASRIIIKLEENDRKENIQAVKNSILDFKGTCPVTFQIRSNGTTVSVEAGKEYKVMPSMAFIERVHGIFGTTRVEIQ